MQNKLKILSVAIAGILMVGCNEATVSTTDTSAVTKTETSLAANTEVQTKTVEAKKIEAPVPAEVQIDNSFQVVEGKHYEVIKDPVKVDAFDGITVTEFFWLGCSACQSLEPAVQDMKNVIAKTENIRVVKSAVPGSQRWSFDAAVFQTLKELGATDDQISQMLKLYERERVVNKVFPSQERVIELIGELGFDKTKAISILGNQALIAPKLEELNAEYNKLKSSGVPVLVVNGKYKVLFNEVRSNQDIINIVKALGDK